MHGRRLWENGKPYRTYEPYPVSIGSEAHDYPAFGSHETSGMNSLSQENLHDLSDDSGSPFSFPVHHPERGESPSPGSFRPMRLLEGLFSDRLDLLGSALEELECAQKEREKLTTATLEEIDAEIAECGKALSIPMLIHTDEKRLLERRLSELKRERTRQKLSCWRDLVFLRSEIRKLRKHISQIPGPDTPGDANGC